jgi:hypothetical protein
MSWLGVLKLSAKAARVLFHNVIRLAASLKKTRDRSASLAGGYAITRTGLSAELNIENFIAHMICFAIYLRAVISCPRWERVVHPKSSSGTDISIELQVLERHGKKIRVKGFRHIRGQCASAVPRSPLYNGDC